jgi:hypothetical protein
MHDANGGVPANDTLIDHLFSGPVYFMLLYFAQLCVA